MKKLYLFFTPSWSVESQCSSCPKTDFSPVLILSWAVFSCLLRATLFFWSLPHSEHGISTSSSCNTLWWRRWHSMLPLLPLYNNTLVQIWQIVLVLSSGSLWKKFHTTLDFLISFPVFFLNFLCFFLYYFSVTISPDSVSIMYWGSAGSSAAGRM